MDRKLTYEEYLAHYGVKGMKWGSRKNNSSSKTGGSEKTPEQISKESARKEKLKKAAIGAGILVGVAGGAYLARKGLMNAKVKDVVKSDPKPEVKNFIDSFSNLSFASRGRDYGFKFLDSGGSKDPVADASGIFGDRIFEREAPYFNKKEGVVGASFLDPEGRKDHAGRTIPHFVVVPKSMAKEVNNIDDVVSKIWPQLKDRYPYTREDYDLAKEKGVVE